MPKELSTGRNTRIRAGARDISAPDGPEKNLRLRTYDRVWDSAATLSDLLSLRNARYHLHLSRIKHAFTPFLPLLCGKTRHPPTRFVGDRRGLPA
jgi:hypothetical protein